MGQGSGPLSPTRTTPTPVAHITASLHSVGSSPRTARASAAHAAAAAAWATKPLRTSTSSMDRSGLKFDNRVAGRTSQGHWGWRMFAS